MPFFFLPPCARRTAFPTYNTKHTKLRRLSGARHSTHHTTRPFRANCMSNFTKECHSAQSGSSYSPDTLITANTRRRKGKGWKSAERGCTFQLLFLISCKMNVVVFPELSLNIINWSDYLPSFLSRCFPTPKWLSKWLPMIGWYKKYLAGSFPEFS